MLSARLLSICSLVIALCMLTECKGQTQQTRNSTHSANTVGTLVGGPFENGEFIYIGMPDNIQSVDTSAGWTQVGQKLLITGTIYRRDGRTPAPNVILYYYHTDINGHYANRSGLDPRVIRHGYIRGWVKSDEKGRYSIYTVRPAPYPGADFPAHIHPAIKESNLNEYYIDEFVFDDDKLLTGPKRKQLENRGGSGILRPLVSGDMQIAEHDIILGLNIPNHPDNAELPGLSGLEIGEEQPSFIPFHAWGPDKGSRACPVCKFGRYHGIIYFIGNNPDWNGIKGWLSFFEKESVESQNRLKVYFVYGNDKDYSPLTRRKMLEQLGEELGIKDVALTYVPSLSDAESEVNLNRISPDVRNTIIVYRQRKIVDKFVDFAATPENFEMISSSLDRTTSEYFNLSEPSKK